MAFYFTLCYHLHLRAFSWIPLQNHRRLDIERDFVRSSGPIPVLKKGHLQSVALHNVLVDLNISIRGGRFHILFQCSVTVTVKKCFLMFRQHLLFVPLTSFLSLSTTEKSPSFSSLHPSFRDLYPLITFTLIWLLSKLNNCSTLNLFSYEGYSSPLIIKAVLWWTWSQVAPYQIILY